MFVLSLVPYFYYRFLNMCTIGIIVSNQTASCFFFIFITQFRLACIPPLYNQTHDFFFFIAFLFNNSARFSHTVELWRGYLSTILSRFFVQFRFIFFLEYSTDCTYRSPSSQTARKTVVTNLPFVRNTFVFSLALGLHLPIWISMPHRKSFWFILVSHSLLLSFFFCVFN